MAQNIYSFKMKNIAGEEVSLSAFKGKVILVVNTASECGFTPQYKELEALYEFYKDKGFVIIAFPSNDFGKQEPLNGKEIRAFCEDQYHTTFPIFDKIHVKGKDASGFYKFLSDKKLNGHLSSTPKWNFHKYLINRNGEVVDYFYSTTKPTSKKIKKTIEKLLR
ncbi:MAG: glutathione peroxidase [Bacteroidia bacterium]